MAAARLARLQLGQLPDPHREAALLSATRSPDHGELAELWLAIGEREPALEHGLAAFRWAWADGEPYVRAYALGRARSLLEQLGEEAPQLPPYDPARDPKLPWEDEVAAAIEKLRAAQGNRQGRGRRRP